MTLCRQKVTKQVKMCGFLTTIIENSAFAILTRYENFSSSKSYHTATAPISTILFTLCPMPWRNVMGLIQNRDNQNQQAKSFQIRCNLSKMNDQNYQTLRWIMVIHYPVVEFLANKILKMLLSNAQLSQAALQQGTKGVQSSIIILLQHW